MSGESAALFNPRTDRWHEHFQVDPDCDEIIGLTPTGRVTVIRLELNAAYQLAARAIWVRFGLFP